MSLQSTHFSQGQRSSKPNQLGIYPNFVAPAHAHPSTIADQVHINVRFNRDFIIFHRDKKLT
jgi:hypothetical protein